MACGCYLCRVRIRMLNEPLNKNLNQRKSKMGKTEKFWLSFLFQFVIQGLTELIKSWGDDDDDEGK